MIVLLWTRPGNDTLATLLLAHGSGAPMDSPFMNRFAEYAAEKGIATARFEFPYMAQRRHGGSKRPPPRVDGLMVEFNEIINAALSEVRGPILIGGKSMGGRVAAMLGSQNELDERVAGIVCLGYPLHPQGKPDQLRLEPLTANRLPLLIVQGDRDPFGTQAEFDSLSLPGTIDLVWAENGNHDLAPTGRSPATWQGNLSLAAQATRSFAETVLTDRK
ncbi:MAG: alpha/beta fold hydrolase [Stappiaceae bacterium]